MTKMILKFRKDAIKRKNIVNRYRLLVSMQGGTGNKRCIIIIIVISAFKDLVQGDYIFLVRKKNKKNHISIIHLPFIAWEPTSLHFIVNIWTNKALNVELHFLYCAVYVSLNNFIYNEPQSYKTSVSVKKKN